MKISKERLEAVAETTGFRVEVLEKVIHLLSLMEELPAIAICICQTLSRRVRDLTERVTV